MRKDPKFAHCSDPTKGELARAAQSVNLQLETAISGCPNYLERLTRLGLSFLLEGPVMLRLCDAYMECGSSCEMKV